MSSLWLSIGLSVAVAFIVLLLIAMLYKRKKLNPVSFILAVCMTIALSFPMKGLTGAVAAKGYVVDGQTSIEQLLYNIQNNTTTRVAFGVADYFGFLSPKISSAIQFLLSGQVVEELAISAQDYLNEYITWRIVWAVLIVLTGTLLIVFTMKETSGNSGTRSRYSYDDITHTSSSRNYRSGSYDDDF